MADFCVYAEDISKRTWPVTTSTQFEVSGNATVKDSPAEKAGLKQGDVILRIDGENVTSVRKLNRVVSEIAPDQTVRVSVSRNGTEHEVTATMGRRSNNEAFKGLLRGNAGNWEWEGPTFNNDGPWTFALAGSRRIGISTTELTKQLADYFGVTGGKGVLVTSVSEDGPAAKAGLKAGDVITAVDGESVEASGDISRIVNRKKEGEVTLTIIRNRTQQTMRVMPLDGGLHGGTTGGPQIGRRIVFRIELGPFRNRHRSPESKYLPFSIDIQMPRIRFRMSGD